MQSKNPFASKPTKFNMCALRCINKIFNVACKILACKQEKSNKMPLVIVYSVCPKYGMTVFTEEKVLT